MLMLVALLQDRLFDAKADIDAALAKSKAENRRVLVVWGADGDEASRKLVETMKGDKALAKKLKYEYDVVRADASAADLAKRCGADLKSLPALSILDADGKPLANGAAPAEAKGLVELLTKHQAEPWAAKDVLDAATAQAKESKRRVLLHFGAPW